MTQRISENAMPASRVAHLIYSRKIGGSEMVAAGVCANLDRTRFDPIVLFMNKTYGGMPEILARLGVACHGLDMTRLSRILRPFIVANVLNRLKIDVLHVHHIPLYKQIAFAVKLTQVKGVVVTEHAKFSISRSTSLQRWCRRAAKDAAAFSVVSDDLKRYFINELSISNDALQVISNGVDTERFRPVAQSSELRALLPAAFHGNVLISVGRLAEAKDQVTLLRAMKVLKDKNRACCLALVGEGELRESLESIILELGLQNHVHLFGNRTDVDALLPQADMFVLSSRREGLPMVLLEAMACGLPIVSTKVGGIGEIVADGVNGFLVPPENPDLLAEGIEQMLTDPDLAVKIGSTNRQKVVGEFSMANSARCYEQLYENIMAGQ